jgi:hypothetical protein
MSRGGIRALAIVAAVAGSLWTPGAANAATTFGSDLDLAPNLASCIQSPCTVANTTLPGAQLTSPIDGVVVRWRVRVSGQATLLMLYVIRPAAGGAYSFVDSSTPEAIPVTADQVLPFATRQPIAAGDLLGVTVLGPGQPALSSNDQAGVTWVRWTPALAAGETRVPQVFPPPSFEVLVNSDVEPDCDSDGLGDETQDADISSCNPATNPVATITSRPKAKTTKAKATFAFTSSNPGSTFQCSLDGAPFAACASPYTVKVKKGQHSFAVRALDAAGHVGSPATASWRFKKAKKTKKK